MTAEQCATRQADHENLIPQLVKALKLAEMVCEGNGPAHTYTEVVYALQAAKEQGYA